MGLAQDIQSIWDILGTRHSRTTQARGEAHFVAGGDIARTARVQRSPFGGLSTPLAPSPTSSGNSAERIGERDRAPLALNDVVARQPVTTFFVRMACDALLDSGIFAGDVLVVDRTLRPRYGALVAVTLDSVSAPDALHEMDEIVGPDAQILVRHYCPDSAAIHLLPAHPGVAPINLSDRCCHIWGVVTGIVHPQPTTTRPLHVR